MSITKQIGKVSGTSWKLEWKIDDFFIYDKSDTTYQSADFHVSDTALNFEIWPVYEANDDRVRYVSLFLCRVSGQQPKTIEFELGIKTVNNEIVNIKGNTTWLPNRITWGWKKFIKRLELFEESQEMVPSGTLTIICFLKIHEDVPFPDISKAAASFSDAKFTKCHEQPILRSKLAEHLKEVFTSKRNSDITLIVKNEEILAHKLVLEVSPVFATLFKNDLPGMKTGTINISDFDPEDFNAFLFFLYSEIVDFEKCNVYQLCKIADKYDVPELKSLCIDFMIRNLSIENFSETIIFGHEFSVKDILMQAQCFFNKNFETIVSSDNWKFLFKENFSLANDLLKAMAPKVKIMD